MSGSWATLQVAKSFTKLRAAVVPAEMAEGFAEAGSREYHSMRDVPTEAFPLFLTSRAFLRMLDGRCWAVCLSGCLCACLVSYWGHVHWLAGCWLGQLGRLRFG
jgi:hypothetical protein